MGEGIESIRYSRVPGASTNAYDPFRLEKNVSLADAVYLHEAHARIDVGVLELFRAWELHRERGDDVRLMLLRIYPLGPR